jgi:hypothetical protein
MNRIASFLSYLMHPVFMPLLSVFILFQIPTYINLRFSPEYFNAVYLCVGFNLIVIPTSLSYYLKRQGMISSMKMELVEERMIPYGITSVFYIITYFLFTQIHFPPLYLAIFLAASIAVVGLLIFSILKIKISAHLTGLGGICGLLLVTNQILAINTIPVFTCFILLAGILATARLKLNAHSPKEVLVGFLLGFSTQLLILL